MVTNTRLDSSHAIVERGRGREEKNVGESKQYTDTFGRFRSAGRYELQASDTLICN